MPSTLIPQAVGILPPVFYRSVPSRVETVSYLARQSHLGIEVVVCIYIDGCCEAQDRPTAVALLPPTLGSWGC